MHPTCCRPAPDRAGNPQRLGDAQAVKYVGKLRDDIKSLGELPLRFPEYYPRPGLRRMKSGRHAVFYLVFEDRIEVVAVRHVASEFRRWL